jgi:hypothetical protein
VLTTCHARLTAYCTWTPGKDTENKTMGMQMTVVFATTIFYCAKLMLSWVSDGIGEAILAAVLELYSMSATRTILELNVVRVYLD